MIYVSCPKFDPGQHPYVVAPQYSFQRDWSIGWNVDGALSRTRFTQRSKMDYLISHKKAFDAYRNKECRNRQITAYLTLPGFGPDGEQLLSHDMLNISSTFEDDWATAIPATYAGPWKNSYANWLTNMGSCVVFRDSSNRLVYGFPKDETAYFMDVSGPIDTSVTTDTYANSGTVHSTAWRLMEFNGSYYVVSVRINANFRWFGSTEYYGTWATTVSGHPGPTSRDYRVSSSLYFDASGNIGLESFTTTGEFPQSAGELCELLDLHMDRAMTFARNFIRKEPKSSAYRRTIPATKYQHPEPGSDYYDSIVTDGLKLVENYARLAQLEKIDYQKNWKNALAVSALESLMDFSSNMIAYWKDIPEFGNLIKSAWSLLQRPLSPKEYANMWLSYRFTDRLTVQDSIELWKAAYEAAERGFKAKMKGKSKMTFHTEPKESWIRDDTLRVVAHIYCSDESLGRLSGLIRKLYEWDAYPTLENAWDMVPFSFVVDWFASVSTVLDQIDKYAYSRNIIIDSGVVSQQRIINLRPVSDGCVIDRCQVKIYSRLHENIIDSLQLFDLEGLSLSLPRPKNYIDGAALLYQVFGK